MNLKDKAGMTAMEVMEERGLPGSQEMLYWYKKFDPGSFVIAFVCVK